MGERWERYTHLQNSKYILNFIRKHKFSKVKIEIYKMMDS